MAGFSFLSRAQRSKIRRSPSHRVAVSPFLPVPRALCRAEVSRSQPKAAPRERIQKLSSICRQTDHLSSATHLLHRVILLFSFAVRSSRASRLKNPFSPSSAAPSPFLRPFPPRLRRLGVFAFQPPARQQCTYSVCSTRRRFRLSLRAFSASQGSVLKVLIICLGLGMWSYLLSGLDQGGCASSDGGWWSHFLSKCHPLAPWS